MDEIEFPLEFSARMKASLADDYDAFKQAHLKPSPISIRLNPKKKSNLITNDQVAWSNYGRYLSERPVFTLDPLFHAGTYYVQEASSMFLEQAIKQSVDVTKSLRVLDLSAAPGGKSTHLLSLLNAESLLVSNEVIRSRASILSENIQKWGQPNVLVTNNDPADLEKLEGYFDVMVVDAPCSGEGLFRKDHDAMKEWSTENVSLCASRQKRIVSNVWPALKENGILIYCTCTYNEAENEDNLKWLQQQNEVEFIKLDLPSSWNVDEVVKEKTIGYRFFPHRVNGEGFFLSVMRKKETTLSSRIKIKKPLATPSRKQIETLNTWTKEAEHHKLFQHNDFVLMVPDALSDDVQFLAQHLKIVTAGTTMATIKHDKLIPDHAVALSVLLNHQHFNCVDVSKEDAIKFLRKDAVHFEGNPKGFSLIMFEEVPLGWINVLDNRSNNLYPSEWRIRMAG